MIEQFGYGITREWRDEDKLVVISATQGTVAREGVDEWIRISVESIQNWPYGAPLRFLIDLSHPGVLLNPYTMQKAPAIFRVLPRAIPSYTAVILSKSPMASFIATFLETTRVLRPNNVSRIVFDLEEAFAWLRGVG